jgi:hypothetical protein
MASPSSAKVIELTHLSGTSNDDEDDVEAPSVKTRRLNNGRRETKKNQTLDVARSLHMQAVPPRALAYVCVQVSIYYDTAEIMLLTPLMSGSFSTVERSVLDYIT